MDFSGTDFDFSSLQPTDDGVIPQVATQSSQPMPQVNQPLPMGYAPAGWQKPVPQMSPQLAQTMAQRQPGIGGGLMAGAGNPGPGATYQVPGNQGGVKFKDSIMGLLGGLMG